MKKTKLSKTAALLGISTLSSFCSISSNNVFADMNDFLRFLQTFLASLLGFEKEEDNNNKEQTRSDSTVPNGKDGTGKDRGKLSDVETTNRNVDYNKLTEYLEKQIEQVKKLKEDIEKIKVDVEEAEIRFLKSKDEVKEVENQILDNKKEKEVAENKARELFLDQGFNFDALGTKLMNIWLKNSENFKDLKLLDKRSKYLVSCFKDNSKKAYFVNSVRGRLENVNRELNDLIKKRKELVEKKMKKNREELLLVNSCLKSGGKSLQKLENRIVDALEGDKKEKELFIKYRLRNGSEVDLSLKETIEKECENIDRIIVKCRKDPSNFVLEYKKLLEKENERIKTSKDLFYFDKDIEDIKKEKNFIENNLLGNPEIKKDLSEYDEWIRKSHENDKALQIRLKEINSKFKKNEEDLTTKLKQLENESSDLYFGFQECKERKEFLETKFTKLKEETLSTIDIYKTKGMDAEKIDYFSKIGQDLFSDK